MVLQSLNAAGSVYATAMAIGFLHGVEPGHGWPVAALYALGRRRRWLYGGVAGTIIAGAHLVSSFAVVALFALLDRWLGITDLPYVMQVAGLVLIAMAVWQWRHGHVHISGGHHHDHPHGHEEEGAHEHDSRAEMQATARKGLWGIVVFAFALGFAHEEEFAIIALCAGKASCWGVMGVYALAVAASILVLTLLSVATFNRYESKLTRWKGYLPKASAVILGVMGLAYFFELI